MKNWAFLYHEQDEELLEEYLFKLYGIVCPNVTPYDSLKSIYQKVIQACSKIGAFAGKEGTTDTNYFTLGAPDFSGTSDLLDFLVIDCLFQIRHYETQNDTYRSFGTFYHSNIGFLIEAINKPTKSSENGGITRLDDYTDTKTTYSNFSTALQEAIMHTQWQELFGIRQEKENANYTIPRFMDHLLILTLDTIMKNPYGKNKNRRIREAYPDKKKRTKANTVAIVPGKRTRSGGSELSPNSTRTFFKMHYPKWISAFKAPKSSGSIDDEIDRLLSLHVMERVYDLESMLFFINNKDRTSFKIETIMESLGHVFFVPNPLKKSEYLEWIFQVIESPQIVDTQFDWWERGKEVIATITQSVTPVEAAATNLKLAGDYLRYIATVFYPVLTSCFYVSLKKIFPEEQTSSNQMMKKHLLHYVKEQHLLEKYLDKGEQHCSAMASFNLAEWKLAAHYCLSQATKIWADPNTMREWEKAMTLQYTEVDNKYQDVMMNAVIRAKVQAPQQ